MTPQSETQTTRTTMSSSVNQIERKKGGEWWTS